MKRKTILILAVVLLMTAFLIGCDKKPGGESTPEAQQTQQTQTSDTQSNAPEGTPQIKNEVSVGLIYSGDDYETNTIKRYVESLAAISSIKIDVNVLEADPQDPGSGISQLVQSGSEIIFACGVDDTKVRETAAFYPNVYFEIYNAISESTPANVGVFALKIYQQQYLNGMIAGFISQTGCIGYISDNAQSTDIRRVNAFALGAKASNPDAVVHFAWSGERQEDSFIGTAADSLSGEQCDVIFKMDIDDELYLFAQENAVMLMGGAREGYENVIPMADTDAMGYILGKVRSVAQGNYLPDDEISGWIGIDEGYSANMQQYEKLSAEQALAVSDAAEEMASGWDVFTGPISDIYGNVILPEGVSLPEDDLLQMLWYVDNIKALPPPMG